MTGGEVSAVAHSYAVYYIISGCNSNVYGSGDEGGYINPNKSYQSRGATATADQK